MTLQIRNRTDILKKYKLIVRIRDTKCDTGESLLSFYYHLIDTEQPKIMILGGGCSISTWPIARVAPYFGLVQVSDYFSIL